MRRAAAERAWSYRTLTVLARARGAIALALVGALLGLGGWIGPSAASGAEVGLNVAATSGNFFNIPRVAALREARPAWVRVFIGWDGIEPAQGQYNTAEIANYQHFFAQLPPGTKIDVDVEGTPGWADAGANDLHPPQPRQLRRPAQLPRQRLPRPRQRLGDLERRRLPQLVERHPHPVRQPAQGRLPRHQVRRPKRHRHPRRPHRQRRHLPPSQLYAHGAKNSFDIVGVHTDTGCNITCPYTFEFNAHTHTINQYFFLGFISVHTAMLNAGDANKPIYMTELGWSSTSAECQTGALGRPKTRRRHHHHPGHLPPTGLPLPRPAAILLRQGRDLVRALQQRHHPHPTRQLRPAQPRLHPQTRLHRLQKGIPPRRPTQRPLRQLHPPDPPHPEPHPRPTLQRAPAHQSQRHQPHQRHPRDHHPPHPHHPPAHHHPPLPHHPHRHHDLAPRPNPHPRPPHHQNHRHRQTRQHHHAGRSAYSAPRRRAWPPVTTERRAPARDRAPAHPPATTVQACVTRF